MLDTSVPLSRSHFYKEELQKILRTDDISERKSLSVGLTIPKIAESYNLKNVQIPTDAGLQKYLPQWIQRLQMALQKDATTKSKS